MGQQTVFKHGQVSTPYPLKPSSQYKTNHAQVKRKLAELMSSLQKTSYNQKIINCYSNTDNL